jgi:hypothetical protein
MVQPEGGGLADASSIPAASTNTQRLSVGLFSLREGAGTWGFGRALRTTTPPGGLVPTGEVRKLARKYTLIEQQVTRGRIERLDAIVGCPKESTKPGVECWAGR